MLRTLDLEFDLPDRLIARRPAAPRDSARLLVIKRSDPAFVAHRTVAELTDHLREGDVLAFNRTTVVPARVLGRRRGTGGRIGGLFVEELGGGRWVVLLQSGGRLAPGDVVDLADAAGGESRVWLRLVERSGEGWLVVVGEGSEPLLAPAAETLARVGATPLPPYILKARRDASESEADELDRAWYQTVYAESRWSGSVAAPTAGLHFTPDLLRRLLAAGVQSVGLGLRVGLGTFKPVESETIEAHDMHAEWFEAPGETLRSVASAKLEGRRVIAVGTTSARTLESVAWPTPADALERGASGWTKLLVTPGHTWRRVDGLLTNFHLPRSTLLALVGALLPEGVGRLLDVYREAVRLEYRFFSYGDAMLVLP